VADVVPPTTPNEDPDHSQRDDARNPRGSGASDSGGSGTSGEPDRVEEWRRKQREQQEKKGSFWKELPLLVLTAVVLAFLIQTFLARVYVIPSQSMEQTLHGCPGCTNDRVLVDKLTYRFTDPKPGDVIVFRGPESWGANREFQVSEPSNPVASFFQSLGSLVGMAAPDERDFVKRVIAVGGQTVQCCDEQNRVLVDGKPLDEPYIYFEPGSGTTQEEFAPVTVPEGHLWVMGDNRNNSADSRAHVNSPEKGTVPVENVIGKARLIVLPPSRWQGIGDHNPQAAALSAPLWQMGVPAGVGLAAAFPVLWGLRRLHDGVRRRWERRRRQL